MPSSDLQFDLEMARRSSTNHPESESARDENGEQAKKLVVEFGVHTDDTPELDEDILEQLAIPPPLPYQSGLERELRSNAIFMYNRSIALLTTEQIISHALKLLGHQGSTFTHLEWIDDFSCILAFRSNKAAIEALTSLLMKPDELEGENGLPEAFAYLISEESADEVLTAAYEFISTPRPAKPFPSNLFDENPKNKLHRPTKPEQLIPFIRFATTFDVKDSSSRHRSLFYALHGAQAGQEGVLAKRAASLSSSSRRAPISSKGSPNRRSHLDRLDQASSGSLRPIKRLPSRITSMQSSISAALDDELDQFMKNGDLTSSQDLGSGSVNSKRNRGQMSTDQHEDGRQKRRISAPIPTRVNKPTIELLPDRPGTRGGNLRDELFHSDTLITNFEGIEPRIYPYQPSFKVEEESRNGADSKEPSPTEDDEVDGLQDEQESSKPSNADSRSSNSKQSIPQDKTRWGPLFSRLS